MPRPAPTHPPTPSHSPPSDHPLMRLHARCLHAAERGNTEEVARYEAELAAAISHHEQREIAQVTRPAASAHPLLTIMQPRCLDFDASGMYPCSAMLSRIMLVVPCRELVG
jgi:hypothetical protein